jgi:hypothetical protein
VEIVGPAVVVILGRGFYSVTEDRAPEDGAGRKNVATMRRKPGIQLNQTDKFVIRQWKEKNGI